MVIGIGLGELWVDLRISRPMVWCVGAKAPDDLVVTSGLLF
jgi:hypothetical protein